jgi:hypothetical protein
MCESVQAALTLVKSHSTADQGEFPARRANHLRALNPVQPLREKYSASFFTQITCLIPAIPPERGAFRDRHERGLGCGGRDSVGREEVVAGRVSRERQPARRRTAQVADGEIVWS